MDDPSSLLFSDFDLIIFALTYFFFFFFNDTATTEIYTLSLHDALPIWWGAHPKRPDPEKAFLSKGHAWDDGTEHRDRKSTRLNSSHDQISYAVFCLKKKKKTCPRSQKNK